MNKIFNLATLLVLTIQVMAQDQTHDNRSSRTTKPALGASPKTMSPTIGKQTVPLQTTESLTQNIQEIPLTLNAEEQFKVTRILQLKQIEVYQANIRNSLALFNTNNTALTDLLARALMDQRSSLRAADLRNASLRSARLAREMQEEAEAQPSVPARLGALSNADEKALLALDVQKEALLLIQAKGKIKEASVEDTNLLGIVSPENK